MLEAKSVSVRLHCTQYVSTLDWLDTTWLGLRAAAGAAVALALDHAKEDGQGASHDHDGAFADALGVGDAGRPDSA